MSRSELKSIALTIESYLNKVEQNDIKYYSEMKENGWLFTEFRKPEIPVIVEKHQCFANSKRVNEVNSAFEYYEGFACINGQIVEHAINVYKGNAYDFTSSKFGLKVEWFFGAKDIIRNNPILSYCNNIS
jgi:hypothetical protein